MGYIIKHVLLEVKYFILIVGVCSYGYPDPEYFKRVVLELESKGVSEKTIDEDVIKIAEKFIDECK